MICLCLDGTEILFYLYFRSSWTKLHLPKTWFWKRLVLCSMALQLDCIIVWLCTFAWFMDDQNNPWQFPLSPFIAHSFWCMCVHMWLLSRLVFSVSSLVFFCLDRWWLWHAKLYRTYGNCGSCVRWHFSSQLQLSQWYITLSSCWWPPKAPKHQITVQQWKSCNSFRIE